MSHPSHASAEFGRFPRRFPRRWLSAFALLFLLPTLLRAQAPERWSDPATWGGSLPAAGETVIIPADKAVLLDVSPPPLQGIQVMGRLVADSVDLDLSLGYLLVMGGEFRFGTDAAPYRQRATVTFTGDTADVTNMGLGNKFLMVMGGGRLELHGHRRDALSWTRLSRNAKAGNRQLELVDAPDWRVGDQIVIAPSGTRGDRAEVRTITQVAGHVVKFAEPLSFHHYGRIDTVEGYAIDMRAEVGLLSRDIVLQGDPYSESIRMGGHVMIMNGSSARVQGVEFYRMGWFGQAGRYPMHWHFSGNSYGEYASNNSVHRSFHRAFVTHGTNGVKVNDNVAHDIVSHAFVIAEDGMERDNEYQRNLGVYTHRIPDTDDFAFPGTFASSQSELHPGTFWLTNPDNIVRDNVAAGGTDAIGFFYDGNGTATSVPDGFFTGNVAHSYFSTDGSYDRAFYRTTGWGLFVGPGMGPETPLVFSDFLAYKNHLGGAWLEGYDVLLKDAVLAANGSGVNLHASAVRNVVVIHQTPNPLSPSSRNYGAINVFSSFNHGTKEPRVVDLTVVNHNRGLYIQAPEIDAESFVRDITFINQSGPRVRFTEDDFRGGLIDLNGQLSGTAVPTLYLGAQYPYLRPTCSADTPAIANRCRLRDYVHVDISSPAYVAGKVGDMRMTDPSGQSLDLFDARIIDAWLPEFGHRQTQWVPVSGRWDMEFLTEPMPEMLDVRLTGYRESVNTLVFQVPAGKRPVVRSAEGAIIPASADEGAFPLSGHGWTFDATTGRFVLAVHADPAAEFTGAVQVRLLPLRSAEGLSSPTVEAFPNPFTNAFSLRFSLQEDRVHTELQVFSADGRLAFRQVPGLLDRGAHRLDVPANGLAPGWYRYVLRTGTTRHEGALQRLVP
jgi:hypothetical protein